MGSHNTLRWLDEPLRGWTDRRFGYLILGNGSKKKSWVFHRWMGLCFLLPRVSWVPYIFDHSFVPEISTSCRVFSPGFLLARTLRGYGCTLPLGWYGAFVAAEDGQAGDSWGLAVCVSMFFQHGQVFVFIVIWFEVPWWFAWSIVCIIVYDFFFDDFKDPALVLLKAVVFQRVLLYVSWCVCVILHLFAVLKGLSMEVCSICSL